MYDAILFILYFLVLIFAIIHLFRNHDIPGARRWSVVFGIGGILLVPAAAAFICEVLTSLLSIMLFLAIFLGGIRILIKAIFR